MVCINGFNSINGYYNPYCALPPGFVQTEVVSPYRYEAPYDAFVRKNKEHSSLLNAGLFTLLCAGVTAGTALLFRGNPAAIGKATKAVEKAAEAAEKPAAEVAEAAEKIVEEEVKKPGKLRRFASWLVDTSPPNLGGAESTAEAIAETTKKANKPSLLKRLFGKGNKTANVKEKAGITLAEEEAAAGKGTVEATGIPKSGVKVEKLPNGNELETTYDNVDGLIKSKVLRKNGEIYMMTGYTYVKDTDGKVVKQKYKVFKVENGTMKNIGEGSVNPKTTPATDASAAADSTAKPAGAAAKPADATTGASNTAKPVTILSQAQLDEVGYRYVDTTVKSAEKTYLRNTPMYKNMPEDEFNQKFEELWTSSLRNKNLKLQDASLERHFKSCLDKGGKEGSFGLRGIKSEEINEFLEFAKAKARAMGYELKNIHETDHQFISYDLEKIQP